MVIKYSLTGTKKIGGNFWRNPKAVQPNPEIAIQKENLFPIII
jgi:hypothetical protein